jgi:hypothetical protein
MLFVEVLASRGIHLRGSSQKISTGLADILDYCSFRITAIGPEGLFRELPSESNCCPAMENRKDAKKSSRRVIEGHALYVVSTRGI